ncbi:hypothetical protein [Geodermatophilus sp. SYSU D00700]
MWVLFSDASAVPFGQVRRDLGRYLRLLAVGLLLTVVAGWALAYALVPGLGTWSALLSGRRWRRPTPRWDCGSSPTPPCPPACGS